MSDSFGGFDDLELPGYTQSYSSEHIVIFTVIRNIVIFQFLLFIQGFLLLFLIDIVYTDVEGGMIVKAFVEFEQETSYTKSSSHTEFKT